MKTIRFEDYQLTEYAIDQSNMRWVFAQGSSIQTQDIDFALHEGIEQSGNIIDINGLVRAGPDATSISIEGKGTHLNIGTHGVTGLIYLGGENVILTNNGRINDDDAIWTDQSTIVNNGIIVGTEGGISGRDLTIVNNADGTIRGGEFGIVASSKAPDIHLDLTNHGIVTGGQYSVWVVAGTAKIHNDGIIRGNIQLGDGSDLIDNRGGVVHGTVMGGLGDDVYIVSNADVTLLENPGEGYDTVRSTVSYTLHADFEDLQLLGTRDINGSGNAEGNALTGNSGDNRLAGGKGEDFLAGGLGNDRLSGGSEADRFSFKGHFGHDVITDFADGSDRLLFWRVKDLDDFKELTHDHLSVSGDGLLIHYGDDSVLIRHMTRAEFDVSDIQFAVL